LKTAYFHIQPICERTKFLLQNLDPFSVFDCGIDLQTIADNVRVRKQSGAVFLAKPGNLVNVKATIDFAEIICFFQDGDPRKPGLIDLKNETSKSRLSSVRGKPYWGS
jgi:hypothetical protein